MQRRHLRSVGGFEEMTSEQYRAYLQTDEWAHRRNIAVCCALHRCQVCYRGSRLEVHHRTYERVGHEMPEDLIVLCADCHELFHDRLQTFPQRDDLAQ